MKKVIVFGTFDILHPGHLDFFQQAKKYADYLVVVVARDENVKLVKGQRPFNTEAHRVEEIESLKKFKKKFPDFYRDFYSGDKSVVVDKVLLGNIKDKYFILNQERPDVVCLGYDQKVDEKKLENKLKEYKLSGAKVIRLKPFNPKIYKSSKLKI